MKKSYKKKNTNKGFTLIELLATLAILSIVISLTIYVALNVIGKSKNKSYEVTISNIESSAVDYLLENQDLLFVTLDNDDTLEYQCIQVKNLVDKGFFDNDIVSSSVSKSRTVSLDDYIYIERDVNTKNIKKSVYLNDETVYLNSACMIARDVFGYIKFNLEPIEWCREKELTISYVLKNELNVSDYIYEYKYSYVENGKDINYEYADNDNNKKIVIEHNGTVEANIYNKDNKKITNASIEISKIDKIGPVVDILYDGDSYVSGDVIIPFELTDVGSGVDYSSFALDDIEVIINGVKVEKGLTLTDNGTRKYDLKISDDNYSGDLDIKIKSDMVFDKVKNGNEMVEFQDVLNFDNENPTCRLSVTDSGVTFDKKSDNGEISFYGMNKTGDAVYDNSDNLSLSDGTFYGYVKDIAGNVGSCSVKITNADPTLYEKEEQSCGVTSRTCWKSRNYSCPSGYDYCSSCSTYDCYKVTGSYSCGCSYTYTGKSSHYPSSSSDSCIANYEGWHGSYYYDCWYSGTTCYCDWKTYSCSKTCYNYAYSYYNYYCNSGTESNGYCWLYNQSSCSGSWNTSSYNYGFTVSTTEASFCEETDSFSCNGSNSGETYVSKCNPIEYECSSGKMIGEKYCYVINE